MLLSGGFDSIAIWRLLGCPKAVRFDLNTPSNEREVFAVNWALGMLNLPPRSVYIRDFDMAAYEQPNGYVAFRNPIMILAAAQLDPDVIIGQVSEWAPDKNRRFYRKLEHTVNVRGKVAKFDRRLKIHHPYSEYSKGRLMHEYAFQFGLSDLVKLLQNTWSCYLDNEQHCGRCGGCQQRWNAEQHFLALSSRQLGLTQYAVTPAMATTPVTDQLRWIRDNGMLGYRQIRERQRQNRSARQAHAVLMHQAQS